ncbi:aminotransferase class V-fold PLP-dependent enzyme [Spongiimicrobium salis]|uniref:aminotransferase class V-fold PLP-dependent enzyme n=1 Tax=Spongiimicrobium salis TaxID=1667022 RepID=UPI00374D77CF
MEITHAIKEFPILKQRLYLNTAASGILYDSLLEWRQEHDLDYLIKGSLLKEKSSAFSADVKTTVGEFFGCSTENLALVPNFSLGLNMLLEGLDKKHRVLLLKDDYPSVNWPFETRGFSISYLEVSAHLEERIAEMILANGITVLALSLVQYISGIRIDLQFLKQLKTAHPDLIIIADGTQFCGTTDFNFEDSGIDVLGASAYKWLLSGYGNGFMLFKDSLKEKLQVKAIGYNAADTMTSRREEVRFSKHFEPGHLDTLNFGSLQFSLQFLGAIGKAKIAACHKELSAMAKEEFKALQLLDVMVVDRKSHSTIFNLKGDELLFQRLSEHNIVASKRGNGIRVSFHFYNTLKDIEKLVRILKN